MRASFCPGCGSRRGLASAPGLSPALERLCPRCLLAGALDEWPEAREETDPDAVLVGRRLGSYEVLGRIGAGSTGVVYRARQRGLDRLVALKVLSVPGGRAPIERFLEEARALARLRHPGIVGIIEVASEEGRHYFAMDLVDGPSLARRLTRGPLEPDRSARLVAAVARALDHAHGLGIVHRDLKPANILLEPDGAPRVADFGLARDALAHAAADGPADAAVGTAPYMAPEQAGGRSYAADARTDVYGLGAVLYECLTGRAPFRGASVAEVLAQVREAAPPAPRALRPGIDARLEAACLRALEKDPDRRFPSARAFAEALEEISAGADSSAPSAAPSPRPPVRARPRTLAAAALAASVLAVSLLLGPSRSALRDGAAASSPAGAARVAAGAGASAKTGPLPVAGPGSTRAPDGAVPRSPQRVVPGSSLPGDVATGDTGGGAGREARPVDPSRDPPPSPRPRPGHALGTPRAIAASFGGDAIAVGGDRGGVIRLEPETGAAQGPLDARVGAVRALAVLPGRAEVAAGGAEGGVTVIDFARGAVRSLEGAGDGAVGVLAIDGAGSVFAAGRRDGTIRIVDVATGAHVRTLGGLGRPISALAFAPSRGLLVSAAEGGPDLTLWEVATGRPLRSLSGPTPPLAGLAWSEDGDRLAVLGASGSLWTLEVATGRRLASHDGPSSSIAVVGATIGERFVAATASGERVVVRRLGETRLEGADGRVLPSRATALTLARRAAVVVAACADGRVIILDPDGKTRVLHTGGLDPPPSGGAGPPKRGRQDGPPPGPDPPVR